MTYQEATEQSQLQRTVEWHQRRLGKPTASRFGDIKPGRGTKWSQTTMTYMFELLAERLTGQWKQAYGPAVDWGTEHEDEAREAYEAHTGKTVNRYAFAERDGLGGSPDGLVGDDGCIEIKCPFNSGNHVDYILNGCAGHFPQIQANIYFNNRAWCDFVSYDPRMPEGLQLHIQRIYADEDYISDLLKSVKDFLCDLNELERKLKP